MKTRAPSTKGSGRQGSATVVVLAMLAILMIVATADFTTARTLNGELKAIEKRQIQRINGTQPAADKPPVTNSVPHE